MSDTNINAYFTAAREALTAAREALAHLETVLQAAEIKATGGVFPEADGQAGEDEESKKVKYK